MDYNFLRRDPDEVFIEIVSGSFRTRIEFDWTPEDDFEGVALVCNYHFKGHAIGLIKDNGLMISTIPGKKERPVFKIPETESLIQAGPVLVKDYEPIYNSKGFASKSILSGPHCHIGRKRSGNYIVGFTRKYTPLEIANKYKELNAQEAIKLPGMEKSVGFYFKSRLRTLKEGTIPFPVALIFESPLKKLTHLSGEIS